MQAEEKQNTDDPQTEALESTITDLAPPGNGKPVLIEPDLEFIRMLSKQGMDLYKQCMQCGTCSATCELSPDSEPFPRKELAWATWGLKDRLMADPDVWLCYQCNDCSTRCPRGAKPGDIMAAIRRESVQQWAFPRFLGRWVNEPKGILLLLGIPTALLLIALYLKDPIANALGLMPDLSGRIMYSYTSMLPHWLLISFFLVFSILTLALGITGLVRFWRGMKASFPEYGNPTPNKALFPSIVAALKNIFGHENFTKCTRAAPRFWSHMMVFFGFAGLSLVAFWIITAGINPLMQNNFVYPFGFWNPWKILANLGGIAVLVGCFLMIQYRFRDTDIANPGTYFDWFLIGAILIVVITGFFTEVLHYVRLEPHRQLAYFAHLVFVLALILYLPYSKLAHVFYRTAALVYAEHTGRNLELKGESGINPEDEKQDEAAPEESLEVVTDGDASSRSAES